MATNLYRVGGYATDTPTNIITLWAKFSATGNISAFKKVGSSSAYQVTAGKALVICRVSIFTANTTGVMEIKLGYTADNTVGFDTASLPSSPTSLLGDITSSAVGTGGWLWDLASNNGTPIASTINMSITTPVIGSNYPYIRWYTTDTSNGISIHMSVVEI